MRDWENLRFFLAVARQGTVSAAAKELGVSHSTVLRRIEQFEGILGSKLFKKLQRGYELTIAGEKLFADGQFIELSVDKVLSQAEGHYDSTEGKLRISQPESGILNIYPLYAEFQRLHPDITLEIHSTMAQHNINQQEVDIVLRIAESPPDLLVGRCLGVIKSRVYTTQGYLDSLGSNLKPANFDWIVWRMTAMSTVKVWFERKKLEPHVVLHTTSMPDVLSAILAGMGVGFLSSHEARQHPQLVELFDSEVVGTYSLWILTHRDLRNSERVRTFMRFISESLHLE